MDKCRIKVVFRLVEIANFQVIQEQSAKYGHSLNSYSIIYKYLGKQSSTVCAARAICNARTISWNQ